MMPPGAGVKYVDVRCCCEPGKLLGYLPVNARFQIVPGARYSWALTRPPATRWQPLERSTVDTLTLEVVPLITPFYPNVQIDLAFKSDDTPIETLRRVDGFIEVKA